ncbi:MAG: phage late control D family protein [Bryobacteraceae bacterium]
MALESTRESGLPSTDYYAPNYKIEVEGVELDPESKGDVLDLKVVMDMENMTSFELTVNNWDDKTLSFKYSDTPTFDIGNRVHVQMGYADRILSMVVGQISSLSPKFPESGPPTLAISGLDGMLQLRDSKPAEGETKKYEGMADWEIAQAVASRNGLKAEVTQEGEVHDLVIQKNQDDAQFLKERAARSDRDCFVLTDPGTGEDTLFFVKPLDGREDSRTRVYVFEWGKTLMNFNPKLTLSRQVAKVTVRGWNPRTKQAIFYTATPADLPGATSGGTSGPQAAEDNLKGKQDVVVDAPIATEQEAKDLAISLLRERAYEFITGAGQVIGLPDLRPGDNVELQGLGQRFTGQYYVKKVEHTLNNSGYLTNFEVRRVFDGGTE